MINLGDCDTRRGFFETVRANGLENVLDRTLERIRIHLNPDAISPYIRSHRLIQTENNGSRTSTFLNPDRRIIELSSLEFQWNFPRNALNRGLFQGGVIFLRRDHWCKKTLCHESVHSFQNIEFDTKPELRLFVEGLTEFLTGCLLYEDCNYCYNAWKQGTYSYCTFTYVQWTRMFGAFCHYLPLSLLKTLYFQDGQSWDEKYNVFLDEIHKSGFPKFGDIFTGKKKIPLELRFLQECEKNFGKGQFRNLYRSKVRCLDFSNIIK